MDVQEAIDVLKFMPQKAALHISKAVRSALANAREYQGDEKPDVDKLFLKTLYIDEGPTLKRIKPRAYGRAHRISRRTSHVVVILAERAGDDATRAARESRRASRQGGPAEGSAEAADGKPRKPKRARFLRFGKKEDKFGSQVKAGGERKGKSAGEHRKTEKGTKGGRKKK
jgi:large subunit ribosomal protein L22